VQPQGYSSNTQGHVVTLPVLNPLEIRRFIDLVYPQTVTGLLNVVHVGDFTGRQFFRNDVEGLTAYVRELDAQGTPGIYLRATTSRPGLAGGKRGNAADSVEFPGLWADLDFGLAGHADRNELPRPPDEASAASIVALAGLPAPTLWVHSGGGIYPWWLLYEPFGVTPETQNYLTTLSRKWHAVLAAAARTRGWFYGTEASDLARVLRLPGSVNRKVAGRDRPCYIASDAGPRYLLQDLHHAAEAATQRWAVHVSTAVSGPRAGDQTTTAFLATLKDPDGPPCRFMTSVRDRWLAAIRAAGPSCHNEGLKASTAIAEESVNEHRGAVTAMGEVRDAWLAIRQPGATTGRAMETADTEWDRLEQGAWAKAAAHAIAGGDAFFTDQNKCRCFDGANNPLVVGASGTNLPPEFWGSRPGLRHIQDAAHMRSRSPDAVLGAVMARLSSLLPGNLRVETETGMPASLNFYSILLGGPSSGKSTAANLAETLFPFGYDHQSPRYKIGSGQGIAAAYGTLVEGEFKQTETKALFYAHEGSSLLKIAKQRDNITLDTLREAWTGDEIGQKNAAAERDRRVREYAMGFWVCLQPIHAVELFSDTNVGDGTLQRFMWFSATDPTIPKGQRRRGMPQPMPWELGTAWSNDPITLPEHIKDEIQERDVAGSRGEIEIDPKNEHALLRQVKTSCLLAILDNRRNVTDEDWQLAAVMLETSNAVAQSVRDAATKRHRKVEASRIEAKHRELDALDARQEKKVEELVVRVVEKVREKPGGSRSTVRCALSRDREAAEVAIERALARGLLHVEVYTDGRGERLHPA
jgi:hypothetical protein